jgi:hypothetical protein
MPFKASEWAVVIPRSRYSMFDSPYLEPVSIVAGEAGGELQECLGCGQWREHVKTIDIDNAAADICADCRERL